MKIRFALLATAFTLISAAGAAQAASTDLGQTYLGETGTITDSSKNGLLTDIIVGTLSANEEITFSYNLTGFSNGVLTSEGSYKFPSLGIEYVGSSMSSTNGSPTSSNGYFYTIGHPHKTTATSSLVLTSANLSNTSGSAVITDNSIGPVSFQSYLVGNIRKKGSAIITYTVSAISNVPLPASAPMFGLGLAMLAGLGMMKKSRTTEI